MIRKEKCQSNSSCEKYYEASKLFLLNEHVIKARIATGQNVLQSAINQKSVFGETKNNFQDFKNKS